MKILQTDKLFPKHINDYGCYFLSVVHLFRNPGEYETHEEILQLYDQAVKSGQILHDGIPPHEPWFRCYIHDPASLAQTISGKKWHVEKHGFEKSMPPGKVIGCYQSGWYFHFAVPAVPGLRGQEAYNPDPKVSLSVLAGWRVFTRIYSS